MGSMPDPCPARIVVSVCIGAVSVARGSAVGVDFQADAGADDRANVHGCLHGFRSAVGVHLRAQTGPDRSLDVHRRPPWLATQPLGSMTAPKPARMIVRTCMVPSMGSG